MVVAGRLMSRRIQGNASFAEIQDSGERERERELFLVRVCSDESMGEFWAIG